VCLLEVGCPREAGWCSSVVVKSLFWFWALGWPAMDVNDIWSQNWVQLYTQPWSTDNDQQFSAFTSCLGAKCCHPIGWLLAKKACRLWSWNVILHNYACYHSNMNCKQIHVQQESTFVELLFVNLLHSSLWCCHGILPSPCMFRWAVWPST